MGDFQWWSDENKKGVTKSIHFATQSTISSREMIDKKDDLWSNYLIWPQKEISKILNMLKRLRILILLTFQLLVTEETLGRPSALEVDHEEETKTTKYCPWPPCYADSWNVDFAEIPLLNETKTQVWADITFLTFFERSPFFKVFCNWSFWFKTCWVSEEIHLAS